jgi:[protein-PII] uridylyltransferase
MVPVLEALDQAGLLTRLLPEWERVRSKPQRNSYHRFTVDRHLVEAAAAAAALTRRVARPDLLLLGALLHALTEADAAATGPAAWSSWKGQLIGELVRRSAALLSGTVPEVGTALTPRQEELVEAGELALETEGEQVTVVAPDRPGLLSLSAGVLALHRLDVRAANAFSRGSTAVTVFQVSPRFGALPDWALVRDDLRRAIEGTLPLEERLAAREAAYARGPCLAAPPTVQLVNDASEAATVVEVHAPDALGVLHRITEALDACGLDVRTAHISTLGADVVDAFYVVGPDGGKLTDPVLRSRVESAVLAAL